MMSTRLLLNADDVMSDVNFQNKNSLNNFLVIAKTTEHGDVEANCESPNRELTLGGELWDFVQNR